MCQRRRTCAQRETALACGRGRGGGGALEHDRDVSRRRRGGMRATTLRGYAYASGANCKAHAHARVQTRARTRARTHARRAADLGARRHRPSSGHRRPRRTPAQTGERAGGAPARALAGRCGMGLALGRRSPPTLLLHVPWSGEYPAIALTPWPHNIARLGFARLRGGLGWPLKALGDCNRRGGSGGGGVDGICLPVCSLHFLLLQSSTLNICTSCQNVLISRCRGFHFLETVSRSSGTVNDTQMFM